MTMHNAVKMSVVTISLSVSVVAGERPITRAQLPPAVERTVAEQSKGAVIRGFASEQAHGQTTYEVALTVDGHARDISMDRLGHILEVEEEVALLSLPSAVRAGLAKAAGTRTIVKVESLTKKGTVVAYEAVVQRGSARSEIQVGPEGQKLTHPE